MSALFVERLFRLALVVLAGVGLLLGLISWILGRSDLANWWWAGGTVPVVLGLLVSMIRDFLTGRTGRRCGRVRFDVRSAPARSESCRRGRRCHVCWRQHSRRFCSRPRRA